MSVSYILFLAQFIISYYLTNLLTIKFIEEVRYIQAKSCFYSNFNFKTTYMNLKKKIELNKYF